MKKRLNTCEFFCGTKSFSKVMTAHGHHTYTLDNDKRFDPDERANVLDLFDDHIGGNTEKIDVAWFSPPCQGFSVAVIGRNWTPPWDKNPHQPKTESARLAVKLAKKTIALVENGDIKWWFIENPVGKLRKLPFMQEFVKRAGGVQHTIHYCQYGDTRQKPTDIWTNAHWWHPRPRCKRGAPCHEAAPRGAQTGTIGLRDPAERGRIPPALFEEILNQLPKR